MVGERAQGTGNSVACVCCVCNIKLLYGSSGKTKVIFRHNIGEPGHSDAVGAKTQLKQSVNL